MKIVVLGAGMVGSAIVEDLAQERAFQVTAVDARREALARLEGRARAERVQMDLRADGAVERALQGCDLAICAVPGGLGYATLERILRAGKDVVDISFFGEEALSLDGLAREMGVTAVVDCGVAPGLCNILAGHAHSLLDRAERYACYVGGLPAVRRWPYEYKAVFSPADVIEEYTRPARMVEGGEVVIRPALSQVEPCEIEGVGTLEAFNTDGLRTLIHTLRMPWMVEKTLRYPGHAERMRALRESGFFGTEPLDLDGQQVRPIDLTSRLLFGQWKLEPGEPDLTAMRVTIEGTRGEQRVTYRYDLLDRYDPESGTTSMARTTGYTCAIVARQVARGLFHRQGICPPELLGADADCYADLLAGYEARGIHLREQVAIGPAERKR
jgi:saccharopine dehydrogenase-like NADP-dependent oxidoreductase